MRFGWLALIAILLSPAAHAWPVHGNGTVSTICLQNVNKAACLAQWAYGFDAASLDASFATDSITDGGTNNLAGLPAVTQYNYAGWHYGTGASPSRYTGGFADNVSWTGPTVTPSGSCSYHASGFHLATSAPYWLCANLGGVTPTTVDISGRLMQTSGGDCVGIWLSGAPGSALNLTVNIHDNKFGLIGNCKVAGAAMIYVVGSDAQPGPAVVNITHNSVDGNADGTCVYQGPANCGVFFVEDDRAETAAISPARIMNHSDNYLHDMNGRPIQGHGAPVFNEANDLFRNLAMDGVTHFEIAEYTNNGASAINNQTYENPTYIVPTVSNTYDLTAMAYCSSGQTNNAGLIRALCSIDGALEIVNKPVAGVTGHGLFATTYNSVVTQLTLTNSAIYANGAADCAVNEAAAGGTALTTTDAAGTTPGSGNFLKVTLATGYTNGSQKGGWWQPGATAYLTTGSSFTQTTLTNQAYLANSTTMNPSSGSGLGTLQFDGPAQNVASNINFNIAATVTNFTQSGNISIKDLSAVTFAGINYTVAEGSVCHGVSGT